jgi:ribonuclease-3
LENHLLELEGELKFSFADKDLLRLALTHDSYIHEGNRAEMESNERLEFLGDSILDMIVSLDGYRRVVGGEGELHSHWQKLTTDARLAKAADHIHLSRFLQLSEGERKKSPVEESIRAAAFEAIVAAIFLEGGYLEASKFVQHSLIRLG